jgi:hypothetical protein
MPTWPYSGRSPVTCNCRRGQANDNQDHGQDFVSLRAASLGQVQRAMAGHVVIRITERLEGGEPLRTAYLLNPISTERLLYLS